MLTELNSLSAPSPVRAASGGPPDTRPVPLVGLSPARASPPTR